MTRGSRKHVLDWTSRPSFPMEFSEFVGLAGCALADPPVWQPGGHGAPDEACLEHCGARLLPGTTCWDDLAAWWLVHQRGAITELGSRCCVRLRGQAWSRLDRSEGA
jgi:hypothetical protein